MPRSLKIVLWTVGPVVGLLILANIIFHLFFRFVDSYELGYKFNATTGETIILDHTGWIFKRPVLDKVNTIDLRPVQSCISAYQRVLNCKLVKFDPVGLKLFLAWHGRQDYDQGTLSEILKAYAYADDGKKYPFLTILGEVKSVQTQASRSGVAGTLVTQVPAAVPVDVVPVK